MNIGKIGGPPPGMNPDSYAKIYAKQHGISLEEAKAQLKAKFGDPKPPNIFGDKSIDPPKPPSIFG